MWAFATGDESADVQYEAARCVPPLLSFACVATFPSPSRHAPRRVARGEQIFSYYGDDWFDYRTFDELSPRHVPIPHPPLRCTNV